MTTDTPSVTFADLCELEPRLAALARTIKAVAATLARTRVWCANGVWYGYGRHPHGFKDRLCLLVGWDRRSVHPDPASNARLRSEEAYSVAYDALYSILPDCRNCGCL